MAYIQDFPFSLPSSQVQEEQHFQLSNNQTIDNCMREIELETHNPKNAILNIWVFFIKKIKDFKISMNNL